jgi:hypothetical protein
VVWPLMVVLAVDMAADSVVHKVLQVDSVVCHLLAADSVVHKVLEVDSAVDFQLSARRLVLLWAVGSHLSVCNVR